MLFSALLALVLTNALQLFEIILMFGAGTGLIFILRWFWWRINAWSEISAMFASGVISILLNFTSLKTLLFDHKIDGGILVEGVFPAWVKFPLVVLITTIVWVVITFLTKPEKDETLREFYKQTTPGGPGWKKVLNTFSDTEFIEKETTKKWSVPSGILAMVLGCILVYSTMFATGNILYGNYNIALGLLVLIIISSVLLIILWTPLCCPDLYSTVLFLYLNKRRGVQGNTSMRLRELQRPNAGIFLYSLTSVKVQTLSN